MSVRPQIGLQLYTVRDELERDRDGTLRTIASLGYDGVELFGPVDAQAMRAALDDLGLAVAGRHISLDADIEVLAEEARALGCNRVALGWIDQVATTEERDDAVARITALAQRARAAGLDFGFHNHWSEVPALDDGVSLLALLPAWIWLEIDLGWAWWAGTSPLELLEWARGRTPLVHVKDLRARGTREFVPVGDGAVGYDGIVDKAADLGIEWLLVEQDELDRELAEALDRSLKALVA
jgi:sugar phosphate isomerase/epimerase